MVCVKQGWSSSMPVVMDKFWRDYHITGYSSPAPSCVGSSGWRNTLNVLGNLQCMDKLDSYSVCVVCSSKFNINIGSNCPGISKFLEFAPGLEPCVNCPGRVLIIIQMLHQRWRRRRSKHAFKLLPNMHSYTCSYQ